MEMETTTPVRIPRPMSNLLVVERIAPETISKGGIIIPEQAQDKKPAEGKVLQRGKHRILQSGEKIEWEVEEGDHVLFRDYAGTEVKVDGREYVIVLEDEVLAILDE